MNNMPKIITSYVDGYYYPKVLSDNERLEYEELGFKPIDIPQEVIDKWKEHQKQLEYWHKFWMDIDSKLWED